MRSRKLTRAYLLCSINFAIGTQVKRQSEDDQDNEDRENKCMDTCMQSTVETLSGPPLCSITDQESEENEAEVKNGYSCMCTDKIFLGTIFKCILKSCSSSDVSDAFDTFYQVCASEGNTTFPAPDKFLSVVGITTTLTASDLMPTGYVTNSVFPALTATTWSQAIEDYAKASEHSAFWATATATSDDGAVSFGKPTTTAAGSSQGTGTAAVSGGAAASAVESGNGASGNQFVGGAMTAAVLGVAGLVAFL
jgi:hypothetical protein